MLASLRKAGSLGYRKVGYRTILYTLEDLDSFLESVRVRPFSNLHGGTRA